MYKSSYSSFFSGANTPSGFYSLFSYIYYPKEDWRLYILKGGPGCGKSTFMKKIGEEADKRGLYSERIFCSSDPESLDGIILPHMKTAVCDGTFPHIVEPVYPGVCEITVNLGQFRDNKSLMKNRDKIIELTDKASALHKKSTEFLRAARAASADRNRIILSSVNTENIVKFSKKLAHSLLKGTSDMKGREKKRFLSGFTPEGYVVFYDTFLDMCEKRIIIEDSFGAVSGIMLKILCEEALDRGFDVYSCPDPMCPSYKTEQLMIPELSLGFFTSDGLHPFTEKRDRTVNALRFSDREILRASKNRIAFGRRSERELINEAVRLLAEAKAVHDEIERLYYPATDFVKTDECCGKIIKEIFG